MRELGTKVTVEVNPKRMVLEVIDHIDWENIIDVQVTEDIYRTTIDIKHLRPYLLYGRG